MGRPALVLALILAGCSCDGGAGHRDAGRPPPSAPEPLDAQQRVVREWLAAQAISDTHFGAPVLWAWLRPDEAEAVRGGASVVASSPGYAPLEAALAADTGPVAAHLREPERAGRRAAWPSPWASRDGWSDDDAGRTVLARIELRPEALLLAYDTRTSPPTVRFSTDRGEVVPYDDGVHLPELWAGVAFVAPRARAFVLIAPALVARVSLGSPEVHGELRISRLRLTRLARDLPDHADPIADGDLRRAWAARPAETGSLLDLFAAAIPAPDRIALDRTALLALPPLLTDPTPSYDWQSSVPLVERPRFFE